MRVIGVILIATLSVWAKAQEFWVFGQPNRTYGVYRKVQDPNFPQNYNEVRIGNIDVKRTETTYKGKPCILYSSTGSYSPKPISKRIIPPPTIRRYDVWMGADGTPLRVYMQHTGLGVLTTTDAVFNADGIDMTITQFGKSRQTTLYPAEGTKTFVNPFIAMMAAADKDREWVTFSCLEASTAGVAKYKAHVVGKFKQNMPPLKFEGRIIEVIGPGKEESYYLYITNEGQLIQVDLPDGATVTAQDYPVLPESSKTKGGG